MVKRTITITTILLILSIAISLIIVLNKSSFAADGDIASGTSGTCSWVIDKNGVFTISPTNGVSGTLGFYNDVGVNPGTPWNNYRNYVKKVIIEKGVKTDTWANGLFYFMSTCTEMDLKELDTSNAESITAMFYGCSSLTKLDLSGFDTRNMKKMGSVFRSCSSLTSLDISSFDTTQVTTMYNFFTSCNNLNSIKLGPNFKFKGSGVTIDLQAVLPTPPNTSPYTGKWIREDSEYGPYTSEGLKNNYNGQNMAGTWVWEGLQLFNVSYSYLETIPDGASELPSNQKYRIGDLVRVAEDSVAPGYTFSGWNRSGTFTMPAENVEITGYFTANDDTKYIIKHYLQDLKSDDYTLIETENKTGITGTEVNATEKYYDGFTLDRNVVETKQTGVITGDESLELKLYYKRNSYNVTYEIIGKIPEEIMDIPEKETYEYGEEVTIAKDATAKGYTFNGWSIKDSFEMPAKDVIITGSFTPVTDAADNTDEQGKNEETTNQDKEENTTIEQNSTIIDNIETSIKNKDKGILNPKTDDIVNKYLLAGIGGIIVLVIVSRLRRKYSRKAKKVQY